MKMKWLLCVVFSLVHGAPSHPSLGPELECLSEQNLKLKDVMPYIHVVSDVNNELIGRYLACVWEKREIMSSHAVSGDGIYRYLSEIYDDEISNESNRQQVRDASDNCAKVTDDVEWILANKVKNCIIQAVHDMPFLTQPPHN